MQTHNLAEDKLKKLQELFPNAVTEVMNENGEIEKAIDKDVLMQEISSKVVEGREERYQFTWPDKKQSILTANAPISKTLRPCRAESKNFDTTENLYIEGDNLEVLKLIQETYLGQIKMIYIDPPYNTGKNFLYNDDFKQTTDEYLEGSGQFDEEGNRLEKNMESNGRFHTNWLNMIYPRLKLARNLLSDDGVIFISIDDNEQANLKKVCDEIFGAQNFISNLIWQKKFSRSNDATYFSTMHDHILCYCKQNKYSEGQGWSIGLLPREGIPSGYSNPDNDPRGPWTSVILSAKSGSDSLLYEIKTPSGRVIIPPSGRYWSCSKKTFDEWRLENRIWFGKNGDGTPRKKTFLSEVQSGLRPNSLLLHGEAGHNQEGKQETKELFNGVGVFDGPKPVKLLELLIKIGNLKNNEIIIDFFSGSATTAEAVMKLNAKDGGNRKFIMVQLPEQTDEKSEAYKAGYKNICEIGKERIRRAGEKILEENKDKENIDKLDVGFRVLKTDTSNMKDVYYTPENTEQSFIDSLEDNIKEDRTQEDLLFQVMLDLGVPLSSTIEVEQIEDAKVFKVEDRFLVACFDGSISDEVVKQIADMKPFYAVFRDMSMKNDSVAVNFEQIFESISPETIKKVL